MIQKKTMQQTTWFYLSFPACIGLHHTEWSLVFSERQSVGIYSRGSKEHKSYTQYLFGAQQWAFKEYLMDRFTGKEAAVQKVSSNTLHNIHNWSEVFINFWVCTQLSVRVFGNQLHKLIIIILTRSENSIQYANIL